MIASLSTVFGLLATLPASIGLYGVMAYTLAQRSREIGIRVALGADRKRVIWMVTRDVLLLLVTIGIAVAVPASLALIRAVQSQLFGLAVHDPSMMALATVGLLLVACAAGYPSGPSRQPPQSNSRFAMRITALSTEVTLIKPTPAGWARGSESRHRSVSGDRPMLPDA